MTMSRLFSTLRFRLTILVLVVLLPAVTIMVYTAAETHQRESQRIDNEVRTLVLAIAANHQRFFETTRQLATVVAQSPNIRSDPTSCANFLAELLRQNSAYSHLTIFDARGSPICAVPRPVPADLKDEPWFRQLLTASTITASSYVITDPASEPVLVLIFPLRQPEGELQEVVSVGVKVSRLPEIVLAGLALPPSTEVILFDQQGTILLHSPETETWIGQSVVNSPLFQTAQAQSNGVAELAGLDGLTRLFAFVPMLEATNIGLHLAVGISRPVALTPSTNLLIRNLVLLSFVGFVTLIVMWWGAGRLVVRPINDLIAATEKLRQGNLGVRADYSDKSGEIAQLNQAFNSMAAELEQHEIERQKAQSLLQENERRYRRLVERSPEAILVRAGDEIVYINPAGARLLGAKEPSDLIGQKLGRFICGESPDLADGRVNDVFGTPLTPYAELKLQRIDKTVFEAEVSASNFLHNGQPATQIILRDITLRKQSEAELRESEALFRTTADNAPVLIWVAGLDGMRTFFNKPWLDFTGRSLDQEVATGWTEGLFQEDYQPYLDRYVAALKARQSFELEYRLRRADGQFRWMVDIAVPSFVSDGQLAGFTGISLDITERHEAEVALRRSHDQFAVILQGAADGITAQDASGHLYFANDAAAHIYGLESAEALLTGHWPDLLRKFEIFTEDGQVFPADRFPSQLALLGVAKATATIRLRPSTGGDERWLKVKATPIFNEWEQVDLAITIYQDITDLKQAGVAQQLLAAAGRLLVTPFDNATRLADVARLAVPWFADWCALDVVGDSGVLERVGVAGTDLAITAMAPGHPFELESEHGAVSVLQTGVSRLYPFIPDSLIKPLARDDSQIQQLWPLNLKSAMIVPLIARRGIVGALTFVWVESAHRYSQADLVLAEELGRQVALALDNARLYEETQQHAATLEQRVNLRTTQLLNTNARLETEIAERKEAQRRLEESQAHLRRLSGHLQAAREEERLRIAREIHDELGQSLAGLKMDVAWLRNRTDNERATIPQKLDDMSMLIDATVKAVRRISTELRPSILDDLGLEAALDWQLGEFSERTGLECNFESNLKTTGLNADQATALFRICQEALTNVARHAQATQVCVSLNETSAYLMLTVKDNGQGISDTDRQKSKSFGLLGMQERVYLLNGTLDVCSQPSAGTTITVQVPIHQRSVS